MRVLALAIALVGCERATESPSPPPGPRPIAVDAAPAPLDAATVAPIDPLELLYPLNDPPRLRLIRVQQHGTKVEIRFGAITEDRGMRFFNKLATLPAFADVTPTSGEKVGDRWDFTATLKMPSADPKAELDWLAGGGM